MPKAIIAGGRNFCVDPKTKKLIPRDTGERLYAEWWLLDMLFTYKFDFVLCGGASGADELGKQFAISNGIHGKIYNAKWEELGKAAGPERNERMAKDADICLLFPGGTGTADMKRRALAHGLIVREYA